jgi:2-polyprenyl-3-methyl-5-hydroxy-6-metoxy-1,4-benzoquinol methylase
MEKIYITEDINVFSGQDAESRLNKNNDLKYVDSIEGGIHKVDYERWKIAQSYERKTWMENNLSVDDDRNIEHLERFSNYEQIDDLLKDKNSIIELGCGAFTNIRFILPKMEVTKISLLDPLIEDYLNHPHCFYKNQKIKDFNIDIKNTSIEELNVKEQYDVVVMINVLEHCFDVDEIFKKINSLLKNDGLFIFSDVYFDDVETMVKSHYDAGHPLRVSKKKINEILNNYNPIFEKRFTKLYSQDWRNDVYFIGTKK